MPVALALAVPVLAITTAAAVYRFSQPGPGERRIFYIAAEEQVVPEVRPATAGAASYRTAVYREYTDATFQRPKPPAAAARGLDFVGPLVRAAVGDTVEIVFRNRAGFPAGVHADALLPGESDSRAALALTADAWTGDSALVPPGAQHVYRWEVPESAGPARGVPGSVVWIYHSQSARMPGAAALIGPMMIYRRGSLPPGPH